MFKQAANKVLAVLKAMPEFSGKVYMTLADTESNQPPMLVYDITDIEPLPDAANAGEFIAVMSVTLQIWSLDEQEALGLVDTLQAALRAANMVEARDNVFTISEEYTPADPGLPPGMLRIICNYRLRLY